MADVAGAVEHQGAAVRRLGALVALLLVGSALQATAERADSATGAILLDDPAGVGSWAGSFRDVAVASDANLYAQPGVCE